MAAWRPGPAVALCVLLVSAAHAAPPPRPDVGAGELLQQTTPKPARPQPSQKVPLVTPKQQRLPTNTTPLPVTKVVIVGNTIFPMPPCSV